MKRNNLMLLFFFLPIFSVAQKIEKVDFSVDYYKVTITYNLTNCPENYVYDIKVKFKDDSGGLIIPKNAFGDIKGVAPGNNKTVYWDILKDDQELKGNVSAIVEIADKRYKAGPTNALSSILLPGLGDYRIGKYAKNKPKYWYFISGAYLFSGGATVYEFINYKNSYSKYNNISTSGNQAELDNYYSVANKNYKDFQLCLGATVSIWVIDVLYVAIKGSVNKHKQFRSYSMNELKRNFYFAGSGNNFQIGLMQKF